MRTELQLYIKNIAMCIGIVDILSGRRKYHQWKNLIKCYNLFTSQLYTNHNNIQQASDIKTTFQSIIKSQKYIYSLLCIPPLTYAEAQLRSLLYILNPPPFMPHLRILWTNLNLKPQSNTCLPVLMQHLTNKMQILTINMDNWFISQRCHFSSQRTPRLSKKNITSFDQKNINKWRNSLTFPHPMMNAFTTSLLKIDPETKFTQKHQNLKKQLKWNLINHSW